MSSVLSEQKRRSAPPPPAPEPKPAPVPVRKPEPAPLDARAPALRVLSVWATLLVFWLLLSGIYTAFLVVAGIGAALAVTALALRMRLIDREGHPIHLCARAFFGYWPWLVTEIVKSAWLVARVILHPRLPISPRLVRFRPSQTSDLGLVIHANSITLTPGTICIEADHGEFLVHALTVEGAEGVGTGSDIDRRVSRLERG
jgi:multicomponent Na+:H+ antiporter subunit E